MSTARTITDGTSTDSTSTGRTGDGRTGAPDALRHTLLLTQRHLRTFGRMPIVLVMNLVQPMMWLLLFGALFRGVVALDGFPDQSFLEFLTPGVVMMMTLFASAWAGTVFVQDIDRGVLDRLLASSTSRGALIVSSLAFQCVLAILQTLVVLAVAWAAGARLDGGPAGVALLLLGVVLLTAALSSVSNAIALVAGRQEAMLGVSQLLNTPLLFVSSAIMSTSTSTPWVADVARFNPLEWAVVVGREALSADPDAGRLWSHVGLLALLTAATASLATAALRARQRAA